MYITYRCEGRCLAHGFNLLNFSVAQGILGLGVDRINLSAASEIPDL